MARLIRLDSELVRRGLARSRNHAATMIHDGHVALDGQVVLKPARQVNPAQAITIVEPEGTDYVSRGAYKLAGALDALIDMGKPITVEGRRCMDAGASTGGFTDVLLRRGAQHVTSVDVGYGQLAWKLQSDQRVTVMDRTNVRLMESGDITPPPTLVVGDLSFISLRLIVPALVKVAADDADFLLMVKPQFEVGKERLGHGGVVRDPALHASAVIDVATCAIDLGLTLSAIAPSPLPGPAGNVEYFIAMHAPKATINPEHLLHAAHLPDAVDQAIADGPVGQAQRAHRRRPSETTSGA